MTQGKIGGNQQQTLGLRRNRDVLRFFLLRPPEPDRKYRFTETTVQRKRRGSDGSGSETDRDIPETRRSGYARKLASRFCFALMLFETVMN